MSKELGKALEKLQRDAQLLGCNSVGATFKIYKTTMVNSLKGNHTWSSIINIEYI